MKKFVLAAVIFFLGLSTAIIKNTTKEIEDELFTKNENIRFLKEETKLKKKCLIKKLNIDKLRVY